MFYFVFIKWLSGSFLSTKKKNEFNARRIKIKNIINCLVSREEMLSRQFLVVIRCLNWFYTFLLLLLSLPTASFDRMSFSIFAFLSWEYFKYFKTKLFIETWGEIEADFLINLNSRRRYVNVFRSNFEICYGDWVE